MYSTRIVREKVSRRIMESLQTHALRGYSVNPGVWAPILPI